MCVYIYIYICAAVESKPGPKFAFFVLSIGPSVHIFLFALFDKSSFCRGNDIFHLMKKKKDKISIALIQNLIQWCCTTCLDQLLTQPWTNFWLNRFDIFGALWPPFFSQNMLKPPILYIFGGWGLLCQGFLCPFLRGMKRQQNKFKTKLQKRKQDHKMQTRSYKKESRQHRHKTIQFHCLDCKQTTQEQRNNWIIKHKKQTTFELT